MLPGIVVMVHLLKNDVVVAREFFVYKFVIKFGAAKIKKVLNFSHF